jgi:hypothetical protein
MNAKLEKIKQHLVENKRVYIAAGVGMVVGIVIGGVTVYLLKNGNAVPQISQKAIGIWNTQVATLITIDAPGNSGNVIQDLSTGIIYPSQNAAAKALDIDKANISKHLSGIFPNAEGHIFKKIIDGGASHELHTL